MSTYDDEREHGNREALREELKREAAAERATAHAPGEDHEASPGGVMVTHTIVDRPIRASGSRYPIAAILATAETGKAVRITLNGTPKHNVDHALRDVLNRRGYKLHVYGDDETLFVWAEKREGGA